jgi:hypothetical protein
VLGSDWVQQATKRVAKTRPHMLATQIRQKSYANFKRSNIEFQVGEEVLLGVSSTKGVIRFNIKGTLSLRYYWTFHDSGTSGKTSLLT